MKKIPTVFVRDWNGDRSRVLNQVNPGCEWVLSGEGIATEKIDGACCMIRNGVFYKRREIKSGQSMPPEFEMADHDEETGKTVGWVPIGSGPEDMWFREGMTLPQGHLPDGTYELIGPKVQGNKYNLGNHFVRSHADLATDEPVRTFDGIRVYLSEHDMEGLVFHHPDGRMAKIKRRDFGLKW